MRYLRPPEYFPKIMCRELGVEPWPLASNPRFFTLSCWRFLCLVPIKVPTARHLCEFVLKLVCSLMWPGHWTSWSYGSVIREHIFIFASPVPLLQLRPSGDGKPSSPYATPFPSALLTKVSGFSKVESGEKKKEKQSWKAGLAGRHLPQVQNLKRFSNQGKY